MPPTSYKTACNTYFSVTLQKQSHLKKKKKHSTRKSDYEDDLPINYNEKMFKNYIEKLAAITDEYCNRKETRKNTNTQNSLHLQEWGAFIFHYVKIKLHRMYIFIVNINRSKNINHPRIINNFFLIPFIVPLGMPSHPNNINKFF